MYLSIKRSNLFFLIPTIMAGVLIAITSLLYDLNRESLGYAILLSSVIYLVFREKLINTSEPLLELQKKKFLFLIFTVIFLNIFILSLYFLEIGLYHRSLTYFILIAIACGVIATQILFCNEKSKVWLILLEILLLSTNIRSSVYFEFPSLYGVDPFYHIELVKGIIQEGIIPSNFIGRYKQLPIMHIMVAMSKMIIGLNVKNSYFIISIIEILSTVFIFLVARKIFDTKTALLATLMLNISNYHIMWGFWIIPMTLGAVFFTIGTFLILNKSSRSEPNITIWSVLTILFLGISIVVHTVSTFVLLVMLISFFIAIKLYPLLYRGIELTRSRAVNVSPTLLLFFSISMITYWMYIFAASGESFFASMVRSVKRAIIGIDIGDVGAISLASEIDSLAMTLNEAGFNIFIALMVIGMLVILSTKNGHALRKFCLIVSSGIMLLLIYVPALAGQGVVLPARWFIFLYILICILASVGAFSLIRANKSEIKIITFTFLIISLLAFFMITNIYANSDSPIYGKEVAIRYGHKSSELSAASFLSDYSTTTISMGIGYGYSSTVKWKNWGIPDEFRRYVPLGRKEFQPHPDEIVLISQYDKTMKRHFDADFFKQFENRTYNKIFNNGEVTGYLKEEII